MADCKIILTSEVNGEKTEIITFGNMKVKNRSSEVSFSDSETGENTSIIIDNKIVSILRNGEINTLLTFEEGKTTEALMSFPFGELPVILTTSSVKAEIDLKSIKMFLNYTTTIDDDINNFSISLLATKKS